MRAQLRTYHAIPSLQAHQDPNSYKQLQDAPRLKSILKGASEDRVEPTTLEMIKLQRVPRTNPVNMVFVLSQFAPKITELHMPPDRDFYDLLMKDDISSATRARAFLWLLWFYLESDFTEEGAEENPFGAGVDYDVDVRNQGVPLLRMLNPEEEAAENLDPPEEIEFGKVKQQERKRIIETDQVTLPPEAGSAKRPGKTKANALVDEGIPSPFSVNGRTKDISTPVNNGRSRLKYESDMDVDSTRSTPPPRGTGRGVGGLGTSSRVRSGLKSQGPDTFTPSHAGASDLPAMRRARPLTAHQLAVERHRNERIQHILTRGMRKQYHLVRKVRRQQGAIFRALNRLEKMREPLLASEDEDEFPHENPPFREKGFGGLIPLQSEEEDFGEEVAAYAAAYRRIGRRLERWSGHAGPDAGIPSTATNGHSHSSRTGASAKTRSRRPTDHDMDMDSHGLEDEFTGHDRGSDGDEGDLDDADKTMLGADGEETDDEDGLSQDLRTTVPVEA